MFEAHGWIVIRKTSEDIEYMSEYKSACNIIESLFGKYRWAEEQSITVFRQGVMSLVLSNCANNFTSSRDGLIEFCKEIISLFPYSYGSVHFRGGDDDEYDQGNFSVILIRLGKLDIVVDKNLSPTSEKIEGPEFFDE